jgi:hypothetical protein
VKQTGRSSFYGFGALLPPKYTQGIMFGESLAGVLVSINRVWTKLACVTTPISCRFGDRLRFFVALVGTFLVVQGVTLQGEPIMFLMCECNLLNVNVSSARRPRQARVSAAENKSIVFLM